MVRCVSHVLDFAFVAAFCVFSFLVNVATAQTANATTDPSEARALNSIFSKWGISADTSQWNVSGEVCSGRATDQSSTIDDQTFNPFIKCDCSYDNKTTCRITALKVYAVDVVGEIPEELWTLTYLTNLNLGQNYLTGSLPPAIGNLTRMQYMTFGINNLSGELPKELGNLTELIVLSFGSNKFSGSLPSELGKLTKLEQLYFDSSGISGPIPSTFANLRNLVTVWASDMELTGKIPDFIGSWSKLQTLRFEGNSFNGSLPSSFSNLTSLTELRISGLSNGSSSLEFVRNMKSLTILELRNNNISGSIPSTIGEFQNLTQLDLSFNNITGQILESIFNLSSLSYLFLGNNKLSGTLPTQKSSSLRNIDLSYNNLSGSLPTWVNEQNLQLNLVANNLTIDGSNTSGLPIGINCLQKNFPCNRGAGRYYDFAIKCGGNQIRSTDGTVYEMDNATLGPATYFVTDTDKWAVSNVGLFTGSNNPVFKSSVSNQFTGTVNPELFQTARLSASSLRYYGLGLENGFYNITLQFAETAILDSTNTWKSLGRRVFDIYIQGTRVLKDFDIQKEAGGVSYRAVQKQFRFEVSENYLEIHLFWAGKGTCCIPAQGTYGPLIQAIHAIPDFIPSVSNKPPSNKKNRTGLIVGIVIGVGAVCFLSVFAIFCIIQRRKRHDDNEELLGIDTKPYTFSYSELKNATNDFNVENKLGEGGFGPVYKGTLNDGRVIAVKQLSVGSHQGKSQFITEIATISAVQHRNLVKLYGCCIEGSKRLLVYEYLENKSLDQALFGNCLTLNWSTRYDICLGVARGLTYLHEESRLRIVHRDVKASNILLDYELIPKISDFGLAKLYDDKKTHISTRVAGTIGYLAPEYAMRGHLTEKADVFSFGVVALELVSGRLNSDSNLEGDKVYLLEWAWQLHENNQIIDLVDPRLSEFNEEEVKRVVGIALLCTQTSPTLRPSMSRVVAMLSGDIEVSTVTTRPGYLTDWKFEDVSSSLITDFAMKGSDTSYQNSSGSTSMMGGSDLYSPINVSKPIHNETLSQGR
ncbi:probable LRR receptor-like serine/threonine-protein kinase At1g56140 [Cajanus cajan]|nr:probable LRR receptor-like serine/threonine-protein kinase At1g56140 [Cajanus cajan]